MTETTTLAQFSAFYIIAILFGIAIGYRFSRLIRHGKGRFNLYRRNTFIERI